MGWSISARCRGLCRVTTNMCCYPHELQQHSCITEESHQALTHVELHEARNTTKEQNTQDLNSGQFVMQLSGTFHFYPCFRNFFSSVDVFKLYISQSVFSWREDKVNTQSDVARGIRRLCCQSRRPGAHASSDASGSDRSGRKQKPDVSLTSSQEYEAVSECVSCS